MATLNEHTIEKGVATLTVTVPEADVAAKKDLVLKSFADEAELDGFRKGHAPLPLVLAKVGEQRVFEAAAEEAMRDALPGLILDLGIKTVGFPLVTFTTLVPGNPVTASIRVGIYPTVTLPDYKAVAKEVAGEAGNLTASEEEVEKLIQHVRKERATDPQDESTWPELTPEFIKEISGMESLEELKDAAKRNLEHEKLHQDEEKRRAKIMEALVERTSFDVPPPLIANEKERMLDQMRSDLANVGMTLEQYLEKIGKTEDDLREEFSDGAEKRAKLSIIFEEIAQKESLHPAEETVIAEAAELMKQYPSLEEDRVRAYVEMTLTNRAVSLLLETEAGIVHDEHHQH